MEATDAEPALARYRDSVTELMEAGEPLGAWLLAFSLKKPGRQVRAARVCLAPIG